MRRFGKVLIILAASFGVVGCQSVGTTHGPTFSPVVHGTLPVSSTMPVGQSSPDEPPGFTSFCLRFADQCQTTPVAPATLVLDSTTLAKMVDVNRSVNRQIWAVDDIKHYGRAEYWTIPTDGRGDCDDYAVTKRAQLIAAGIPASTLRLAIAVTPRSIRHAVLTVATDQGDYILDSLFDEIVPWHAANYTWMMRQRQNDARKWVSLQNPVPVADVVTAAVAMPRVGAAR